MFKNIFRVLEALFRTDIDDNSTRDIALFIQNVKEIKNVPISPENYKIIFLMFDSFSWSKDYRYRN
jgi:hypothetical protein